MRICSFLPSATEIIADLGLVDSLVGVSQECRWPPAVVGTPVVTAARIDPSRMSSVAIDSAVRASVRDGRSLYTVDADLIAAGADWLLDNCSGISAEDDVQLRALRVTLC